MLKSLRCGPSDQLLVTPWRIVGAACAWAALLLAAVSMKKMIGADWSHPLPALILALAPIAAAAVLKSGGAPWSVLVAASIMGLSIFVPSVLVGAWAQRLFDVGSGFGWILVVLGAYRDSSRQIVPAAALLSAVIIVIAVFL